ncbi:MAG: hypothetical protein N3G20_03805, partial [Verrucomicrobiae bacterium]|nr:hypothetical protein [Verrucomicrobiae bacterium]
QLARYWDRLRLDLVLYEDLTDLLRMAHSVLGRKNGLRLLSGLRPLVSVFTSAVDLKGEAARMDLCGRGAFEELARERGRRGGVRFVFYGHTHEARQDCFDTLPSGDARLYVNTGTFLPFVERARRSDSFWSAYRLGFAFVYGEGEDKRGRDGKGPTLDIWNGIRCKRYVV